MTQLRVCSAAEAEFTQALCWYAERSLPIASEFDAEFDQAVAKIRETPTRFPQYDQRHRFLLMRRFPYQIIYRIFGETVTIIAVAHTSRQPNYWKGR